MKRRLALTAVLAAFAALGLSACGSEQVDVPGASANTQRGAQLFAERCSGCHTMAVAGAQGSATEVSDRERVDGPSFDVRKMCYADALYAIENGGYSGAFMPANLVVGQDAKDVSRFLAEFAGIKGEKTSAADEIKCEPPPGG